MKRNTLTALLLSLGLLVLAACSTGGGEPQLPERTELAPTDDGSASYTGNANLGGTDHFYVDGAGIEGDLIVVELDAELRLELTSITGETVSAVSTGPNYFARQEVPVSNVEEENVDPTAIGVDSAPCRGSCIVLPAGNGTYYFQVSGALLPTPYSAYVYGAPHVDTNEGSNEDPIMAPPYFLGEEDGGALETIGDVDWWTVGSASSASEAVEFLAPGSAGIEVYVVTIDSESGPFPSGTVLNLAPGDLLRVESTLERAARGASGYYYFSPVPDPAATTADPVMAD